MEFDNVENVKRAVGALTRAFPSWPLGRLRRRFQADAVAVPIEDGDFSACSPRIYKKQKVLSPCDETISGILKNRRKKKLRHGAPLFLLFGNTLEFQKPKAARRDARFSYQTGE